MTAAIRPLLHPHVARAGWVVLVYSLPVADELACIQVAAQAGVPVLAIVPEHEHGEKLRQLLEEQGLGGVTLCSELLAADSGEACWYRYNDARHNGTTPPALLQGVWPNLRLESLGLRPTRRLDEVLGDWLQQAGADVQAHGLLWLPATQASAVLSGAGGFLERLQAIWLKGSTQPDGLGAEVLALLEGSCHRLESADARHQLWQLDQKRLLKREVVLLAQQNAALVNERDAMVHERDALVNERDAMVHERDALVNERDALVTRVADCDGRMERINTELDEILALIASANNCELTNT